MSPQNVTMWTDFGPRSVINTDSHTDILCRTYQALCDTACVHVHACVSGMSTGYTEDLW